MSRARRPARRTRPRPEAERNPADFWRSTPELDVPSDIAPAADPTALLRSLGPPPLPGQARADRYVAAVIERASAVATALATVADLLDTDGDDA